MADEEKKAASPWWHDWKNISHIGAWIINLIHTIGWVVVLARGGEVTPPPVAPDRPVIVVDAGDEDDAAVFGADGESDKVYTGWRKDPEAVKAIQGQLPFRVFGDTPAGKSDDPLPDHVYHWEAYRKMFGRPPPGKNQGQVGSCVSFGTNTAIERTMAVDIAINKRPFKFKFIAEEVTYAGSRVEVGGGKIRGDGSVGAWAAKFAKDWGIVPREVHGQHDLTTYSESRARAWGRTGVPDELESLAREHPVKETTLVSNWESAKKALASGYGIAVCSSQGFSQSRDQNGVVKPSGSWMHCMCLDGYHVENGKEYAHFDNSWGDGFFRGTVGWGDPPPSGFWCEAKIADRMLRQGDSWAFSSVKGFPGRSRELGWPAHRGVRRAPADALFASFSLAR